MKKIYFLKTCHTCQRIINSLSLGDDFEFRDIKEQPLQSAELEYLKSLAGSYESLFSRRAKLYKQMGLKDEALQEKDYRQYILEHYTFLKRPVIVSGLHIFIGNSPKIISSAQSFFNDEG